AVQPVNLVALSLLDEVVLWRDRLSQPKVTATDARRALQRLEELQINGEVLARTVVGKVVNEASKKFAEQPDITSIARQLVARWRAIFQHEKAQAAAEKLRSSGSPGAPQSDSPGPAVATIDSSRCMARIYNEGLGGQCSRKRDHPKFLCGSHQTMMDTKGRLTHGWIDGAVPEAKATEISLLAAPVAAAASVNHRSRDGSASEPAAASGDPLKLLEAMRNAPSDRTRMGALLGLERLPREKLTQFVSAGGLAVLERWIRAYGETRFACLTLLQKLPVTGQDLLQSRIAAAVELAEQTDKQADNRQKAAAVIDRWIADSLHPKRKAQVLRQAESLASAVAKVIVPPPPAVPEVVVGKRAAAAAAGPEVKRPRLTE
ncbi:unnamed protein product, partial [Polarella glacialis]